MNSCCITPLSPIQLQMLSNKLKSLPSDYGEGFFSSIMIEKSNKYNQHKIWFIHRMKQARKCKLSFGHHVYCSLLLLLAKTYLN